MGLESSTSKAKQLHKGYLQGWQSIDHLNDFNQVKNIQTNELGQSRKYKLDNSQDPNKQLAIHQLRKLALSPIIKSYSAELLQKISKKIQKSNNPFLCNKTNYIGVITERIPIRLSELSHLTFSQSLYVLQQSLKGYQYLYPRAGPVHVTSRMIGLNTTGNIKVWINQKFYQNYPTSQITSLLTTRNQKLDRQYNMIEPQFRDQKQMIQNIVDVIEEKCQQNSFPNQFHILLRQNSFSFAHTLNFIDKYRNDNNIAIPSNLQHKMTTAISSQNNLDTLKKTKQLTYHSSSQKPQQDMLPINNSSIVHFDFETKSPQQPPYQPQMNINPYFATKSSTNTNITTTNNNTNKSIGRNITFTHDPPKRYGTPSTSEIKINFGTQNY